MTYLAEVFAGAFLVAWGAVLGMAWEVRRARKRIRPIQSPDVIRAKVDAVLVERVRFARHRIGSERLNLQERKENGDEPGLIEATEHFVREHEREAADAEALLEHFRLWKP